RLRSAHARVVRRRNDPRFRGRHRGRGDRRAGDPAAPARARARSGTGGAGGDVSALAATARGERAVGIVVLLLRVAIGAIFLAAGALKIGHAIEFAQEIAAFGIVPRAFVAPMALALPFLEVLLGGYLVLGLFTRAAAWVATA